MVLEGKGHEGLSLRTGERLDFDLHFEVVVLFCFSRRVTCGEKVKCVEERGTWDWRCAEASPVLIGHR